MATLSLAYRSAEDLAAHLEQLRTQNALLVPIAESDAKIQQYQTITLQIELPGGGGELEGEVLQVIPGLGIAVALKDPVAAYGLTFGATPASPAEPPQVSTPKLSEEAEGGGQAPRTYGVLSWPIEKLQVEWKDLPLPERIRVARYGKRPARALVMRLQDPQLHNFLISNPHITADEVAVLAGMGNLDPVLLKRLASSPEWTRHKTVVRNLVCHPKATLPQITQLVDKLGSDELRRLTRTGKVRASVKRLIIKKLEQREGRR